MDMRITSRDGWSRAVATVLGVLMGVVTLWAQTVLVGPVDVVRTTSGPATVTRTFTLASGGTHAVCVANGGVTGQYPRTAASRVSLDGTAVVVMGDFASRPRSLTRVVSLAAGTHRLEITVRETTGAGIAVSLVTGSVCPALSGANRAPTITSTPGTALTVNVGQPFVYDVNATDPDGDALTYALAFAPSGMTIDPSTGLITWSPNVPGSTPVLVKVSDGRGGTATQDFTIRVGQANRPPTITSSPGAAPTVNVGQPFVYDVDATDPDGDALTYALAAGPTGITIDPVTGLIAWSPSVPGSAPVSIQVSDGRGGTATQSFTVISVQPNRPPTITSSPGAAPTVNVGQTFVYDVDATDPDGDALTYALAAGPTGITIDPLTGLITWSPGVPGSASVSVEVSDGRGGTAPQSFTVTALQVNHPPTITSSPGAPTVNVGQTFVYDVDATDPDGDALTYALAFAPSGMTIDPSTGVMSWSPTAAQTGFRTARVEVSDGQGGAAAQGVPIDVAAAINRPPVSADDVYDVGLGQTLIVPPLGVMANDTDPDGQPLTARLLSTPAEGTLAFRADGGFTYTPRGLVAPGALNPTVEWTQSTFRVAPASTQIMVTPVVIDANRDGVPEIYVPTHSSSSWKSVGHLRALAGGPTSVRNLNLARLKNATVQVSSRFSGSYPPERAIDGDPQTSWFTAAPDTSAFFQVTLPSPATVRELRMLGNRQFASGHDFLSGRFDLFDTNGVVLYTTGVLTLPAPDRDLTVTLPSDVAGVTQVRFTATGFEAPTSDNGFAEIEIIGDAVADPGTELWTVAGEVMGSGGVAAADIDGDGFAEIVAQHSGGGLVAFEHDGTVKWRSVDLGLGVSGAREVMGSPSIADLDGDGTPEIVVGTAVLNSDGTLRWGPKADSGNGGFGPVSVVADLDLDGRPEILTGKSAYRADGSVYWTSTRSEGFTAVGNFDLDPFPEVVVVSSGAVRLLEHDGQVKWGPVSLPGGGRGGPPTIADVDADGQPEIGVAGSTRYVVFETDGSTKWAVVIQDSSSNVTGSSVFDFEGDGSAEIVYADETHLRILRGVDGAVLFSLKKGSATLHEVPTIADVDGDGRAEIIAGANDWMHGQETGLFVIGGADNNWIATRALWNQHAYHVTNVRSDGTIPSTEPHHWLVPGLNAFRTNSFAPGDPDRTTSFTYRVGDGALESNDAVVRLTIRQPNSPPALDPIATGVAAVGVEFLSGASLSDPDLGDTHSFELLASPSGMVIDSLTGLVRWTPGAAQQGAHTVTLRVLDQRGLFDVATFMVNVSLPVTVPNVTGTTQAAATNSALSAGLSVPPVVTAYSLSVPLGTVIAQLPLPGTLVAPTTPVYLEVSAGLQPVAVPNVVGLPQSAAMALLSGNGLVLGSVTMGTSNAAPPDTVTVQTPAAGEVVGITTAVNITISTGPAIAVSLSRNVIQAGGSATFVLQAFDSTGLPIVPLPPVTVALSAAPDESVGTLPTVSGNVVITASDTRGRFELRATLPSGDTASTVLVVSRPGAVAAENYSTLDGVIGDLSGDVGRLEAALLSGDLASVPTLRDALVATRGRIDLDSLAGSTAFAPEGGFPPSLAALSVAGFPETPADVAWDRALRDVIATITATEGVYARLQPGGSVNDDARLMALNTQLETRVAALLAISPSLHGVVKRANVVNQLVSVRIPRLLDAQVSAVDRALRAGGLALNLESPQRFYAGLSTMTPGDALDPTTYYDRRQPVFFTLPSLMSATRIQMDIIKRVYVPVMSEVVKGATLLAARNLLGTYTNTGSLVGVVTGASLSFNVFDMPGSVIEGFGFDRDLPDGNQVFIIGPSTITDFLNMLAPLQDHPESFDDLDELVDFFEGVADGAKAFSENLFDPKNLSPSGVVRGCLFDFSSACSELVYDGGFHSVHTSGGFPAPVLFLVRNVTTGSWATYIANFLPAPK